MVPYVIWLLCVLPNYGIVKMERDYYTHGYKKIGLQKDRTEHRDKGLELIGAPCSEKNQEIAAIKTL